VIGQGASRAKIGKARIGSSGKLSFSGASRCGVLATRSGERSSHGFPALTESELAGVPIGGAATVSARMPHIGALAQALEVDPSDNTNAARVHRRTNQAFRVWVAEGMGRTGASLVGRPRVTTSVLTTTFLREARAMSKSEALAADAKTLD